ncbi:hypothetical protein JR316_0006230 [Psilocybe cubensis]|uniref:Uncharacterized protein n=2 Tax=Psilocybe cubensis TaxID=181762 RepID=A0ACB8H1C2_PSICU|nr:hypothetical protein JR316_0006230 [Psilocybe cubensis]KAH9481703.1 hypothetical protein JR316_0006230 [Psilocybe cubensis]
MHFKVGKFTTITLTVVASTRVSVNAAILPRKDLAQLSVVFFDNVNLTGAAFSPDSLIETIRRAGVHATLSILHNGSGDEEDGDPHLTQKLQFLLSAPNTSCHLTTTFILASSSHFQFSFQYLYYISSDLNIWDKRTSWS